MKRRVKRVDLGEGLFVVDVAGNGFLIDNGKFCLSISLTSIISKIDGKRIKLIAEILPEEGR